MQGLFRCACARSAGVFGRVTQLAKVTQQRYNLALAVVLGKDLDGVIVDTKETAQECIQWLRQNQVAPMTFFPLDTVRPKVLPCLLQSSVCDTSHGQRTV